MSTATPVKARIPDPATIHRPYGEAVKKSLRAARRLADLVAEGEVANRSGYGSLPSGMLAEIQSRQNDARGAELDVAAEGRTAASMAHAQLVGDPQFLGLVAATLAGMAGQIRPQLEYEAFRQAAGRAGIVIIGLPDYAAEQVRQLVRYVRDLKARSLITDAEVPPVLAALIPAVEVP